MCPDQSDSTLNRLHPASSTLQSLRVNRAGTARESYRLHPYPASLNRFSRNEDMTDTKVSYSVLIKRVIQSADFTKE